MSAHRQGLRRNDLGLLFLVEIDARGQDPVARVDRVHDPE